MQTRISSQQRKLHQNMLLQNLQARNKEGTEPKQQAQSILEDPLMQKLFPKQIFIRCQECDTDILVLPDIKAMAKAINDHAGKHTGRKVRKASLVNNLTQQLLLVLAAKDKGKLPQTVWLLIESYFGTRRVRGVALTRQDADEWVKTQNKRDPDGSYYHDTSQVVPLGEA